jgi:hypothetical protein
MIIGMYQNVGSLIHEESLLVRYYLTRHRKEENSLFVIFNPIHVIGSPNKVLARKECV